MERVSLFERWGGFARFKLRQPRFAWNDASHVGLYRGLNAGDQVEVFRRDGRGFWVHLRRFPHNRVLAEGPSERY